MTVRAKSSGRDPSSRQRTSAVELWPGGKCHPAVLGDLAFVYMRRHQPSCPISIPRLRCFFPLERDGFSDLDRQTGPGQQTCQWMNPGPGPRFWPHWHNSRRDWDSIRIDLYYRLACSPGRGTLAGQPGPGEEGQRGRGAKSKLHRHGPHWPARLEPHGSATLGTP